MGWLNGNGEQSAWRIQEDSPRWLCFSRSTHQATDQRTNDPTSQLTGFQVFPPLSAWFNSRPSSGWVRHMYTPITSAAMRLPVATCAQPSAPKNGDSLRAELSP